VTVACDASCPARFSTQHGRPVATSAAHTTMQRVLLLGIPSQAKRALGNNISNAGVH
jgi:hypothetical protein